MSAIMKNVSSIECERIASGKQTILISKTRPKINTPFKCYIYMTQGTYKDLGTYCDWIYENRMKVIGEFVCDKIDEYTNYSITIQDGWEKRREDILKASCLSIEEWTNYVGDYISDFGYCMHISDLKIYDEPKELGEFYRPLKYDEDGVICGTKQDMSNIYEWDCHTLFNIPDNCDCTLLDCPKLREFYKITRPPQSWCYVEEL